MKIRIKLKVQSFSDIITNSSSELFAVIKDSDRLDDIYDVLLRIFGWDQESEQKMCVDIYERPTQEDLDGWNWWTWLKNVSKASKPEDYPEKWIEIEMPYRLSEYRTYFEKGIEAILKEKFGDNFTIEYYEE